MSHVITADLELKNQAAAEAAAAVVDAKLLGHGRHKLYSGMVEGIGIKLPGWLYPIVINPETGRVQYDNFGGSWGSQDTLDHFMQAYAADCAREEAVLHGYMVDEETLENGDLKLTVTNFT